MALKSIQQCHIDPHDRAKGLFTVTINATNGNRVATMLCSSERDAIKLRNAIRDHADELISVLRFKD